MSSRTDETASGGKEAARKPPSRRVGRLQALELAAVFLLAPLFVFVVSSAGYDGYEVSIYDATPRQAWGVWLALVAWGGVATALSLRWSGQLRAGPTALIAASALVVVLPLLKGYKFYIDGDPLTHAGFVLDILEQGRNPLINFYPMMHVLVAVVSLWTGLDPLTVLKLQPLVTYLAFLLFTYVWLRHVTPSPAAAGLGLLLAASMFLRFGYYTRAIPNALSLFVLPALLFLVYRRDLLAHTSGRVCLVVMLVFLPFAHPLTTLIAVLFLVASFVVRRILGAPRRPGDAVVSQGTLLMGVVFIFWMTVTTLLARTVRKTGAFLEGGLLSPAEEIRQGGEKLGLSLYDIVLVGVKTYAAAIIIAGLAAVGVLWALRRRGLSGRMALLEHGAAVAGLGAFLGFFFVVGDPGILPFRSFNFVFLFALPLAGLGLALLASRHGGRPTRIGASLVAVLVVAAFALGAASTYDSPYVDQASRGISHAHWAGEEWFVRHKDQHMLTWKTQLGAHYRFADAILGTAFVVAERDDMSKFQGTGGNASGWANAPDHFGLGDLAPADKGSPRRYLIYAEEEIVPYETVWAELARYTREDIARLANQPRVDRLYVNGDFTVWVLPAEDAP